MYDPFDVNNHIKQANYNDHEGAIKQYDSFNDDLSYNPILVISMRPI